MTTVRNRSAASIVLALVNVASGIMLLGLVLTVAVVVFAPAAKGPVEVGAGWLGVGTQMTIPVAFSVDPRTHSVAAPSLNVDRAEIRSATGALRFPMHGGPFFLANGILLAVLFGLALWGLGQLRAVVRTVRDGHPFAAANATRIRWIGCALIVGEIVRASIVFFEHWYAKAHFVADGLRFEARPDVHVLAFVYGLIVLVIAEVFRDGTRLDEDQSLTI